MRMVDYMETTYMHGHTRSLSCKPAIDSTGAFKLGAYVKNQKHSADLTAIASTILPMASDASTYTSVTASPLEPHDAETLPIELKIPLPSSSCCSEHDFQFMQKGSEGHDQDQNLKDYMKDNEAGHEAIENEGPMTVTLEDLAALAESESQHKLRLVSASSQSDQLSVASGLKRRYCSTLKIAYGNLIDQYKSDDQAGFAGLHEALQKLKDTCVREAEGLKAKSTSRDTEVVGQAPEPRNSQTWFQHLSDSNQSTVLNFLLSIRNNPEFLATRIGLLSPLELGVLTSSYHTAGVEFSVLANHSHGMTQMYSRDSQMMKLSRRMDNVQHFHDQDPFFTLMYGLFDPAAQPNSMEHARRNNAWSSVCAKAIMDQKSGNEELIVAVADAFMGFDDWALKPRMELYIQTVLAEGSFLVDSLANPLLDTIQPLESKTADYALRVDEFFKKALNDLFDLIASAPHGEALPRTPRDFVQATIGKVKDSQLRATAKDFLISRWYFASCLSSILVYPELAGLFMTQHIGENARQNILRQIVIRMQLQVFDVLRSKADDMMVTLERRVQILAISSNFEPLQDDGTPRRLNGYVEGHSAHDMRGPQIMLSHQELAGLIRTLYPNNPLPAEDSSQPSSIPSTSAPPSTTSSSTLQPEMNDVSSSASSSIGPNFSTSSVNSDVTITGNGPLPPQAHAENVSDRLFANATHTLDHSPGLDVDRFAYQLWILHAQLQEITRKVMDSTTDHPGSPRWAVFQVRPNGVMALNAMLQSSELLARNSSLQLTSRSNTDSATLEKAIATLLTATDSCQLPKLDRSRPLTMVQESLCALFEDALASSKLSMDFSSVHHWQKCLEIYSRITSAPGGRDVVRDLLGDLASQFRNNIREIVKQAEIEENLARSVNSLDRKQKDAVSKLEDRRNALRIKMWYLHDVKHSSTYEEALLVTKALRAMSGPKRNKQPGGTFSWARQRLRGSQSQERAESQTLEAMTAPKDRGGRRKLADDQVEMTSRWLTRKGIENLCAGEERIHRYCYQVQKSVDRLAGPTLLDSPVLWSSHLFKREKASLDARNLRGSHSSYKPFTYGSSRISLASPGQHGLQPISSPVNVGAMNISPMAYVSSIPSSVSNHPPAETQYSSSRAAHQFLQPLNPGLRPGRPDDLEQSSVKAAGAENDAFVQNVKNALYGLLTSDLGYLLWAYGCETDAWIDKAAFEERIGEKSTSGTVRSSLEVQTGESQHGQTNSNSAHMPPGGHENQDQSRTENSNNTFTFDSHEAYQVLLNRMSTTYDPFIKLEMILQLERLVIQSIEDSPNHQSATEASIQGGSSAGPQSEPMARSKSVPRTQATILEEVIANCTERRAEALRATPLANRTVSTDAIVNQLLTIFRSPELRPANLFLSLQYIAAFIPIQTLDHTPHGEAFWNCSLAALALKEDLTNITVRRAAEITNAHISTTVRITSPPFPSQQEAANLWLIAAKEGSPVAARELGLFYLTHPQLLPQRVTKPLSMAKDVFKSARGGDGMSGDDIKERGGLNPLTFDVVYHWMVIASNGGDAEAKVFLRQSGNA